MAFPNLVDLIIAWIAKHQTILVAVYGAVVATAVAVWNILREITNRGRLRVMVNRADVMATGVGQIGKDKLWFKVTNVGRQPIWLSQIGGGYRNGKHFLIVVPQELPMKLEPGQSFGDWSSDARNLEREKVTFLGAWDSLGKIHKLPRRHLKAPWKDVKGGEA